MNLFDTIAPVYNWFFKSQLASFSPAANLALKHGCSGGHSSILDLGCGTGPFCRLFSQAGHAVSGVDQSHTMLKYARKNLAGTGVRLFRYNILEGLPFDSGSFHMVFSSFVLHGLTAPDRSKVYKESHRLSSGPVIFYDYGPRRRLITDLIEWAEGGDYFNFIKTAENEMREHFNSLETVPVDNYGYLYICR